MQKKLIAGNWKMNLSCQDVDALMDSLLDHLSEETLDRAEIAICPPAVYIRRALGRACSADIAVGGQDCCDQGNGAYTGQISAEMLADCGCSYVILGHSERRQYNGETSALVKAKAQKALEHVLTPIICVGETAAQRASGQAEAVVRQQLVESLPDTSVSAADFVIAYEPVWAIGTGQVASVDDVAAMHSFIYNYVETHFSDPEALRILYGGSMKPENAQDLLATPHVDGGLIGGASLNAESFLSIASCA